MDELEYIVKDALMMCDKGASPDFFKPTFNTSTKIEDILVATEKDGKPKINIPSFKICQITGTPCKPETVPDTWKDTWDVKINGAKTLIGKSTCPCKAGGTVEFMTSGQVPLPEDAMQEVKDLQEQAQGELNDAGYGDTVGESGLVEGFVPVWGSGRDSVNSFQQGKWGWGIFHGAMVAVDVCTLGIGSLVKGGVKAGVKTTVKTIAKNAFKSLGKGAFKKLSKEALKKSIDDVAKKLLKTCVFACFPAGTQISTEFGFKNIEEIEIGDKVWSYNEETGEIGLQEVEGTFERISDHTVEILTESEIIETTAQHPFFVNGSWKEASELQPGDKILTKEQQEIEIKDARFKYESKKVYNFEVANWHTYFVGVFAWLVHNANRCLSEVFKFASEYGLKSYKELKALLKGTGLEAHHLIEKRFASIFKPPKNVNEMLSMALTKTEHQKFTNAWRKKFPYGKPKPSAKEVESFARELYKDYPEILKGLGL